LLACVQLRFQHPMSGEVLCVKAPLGDQLLDLCRHFGWPDDISR